MRSGLRLLLWTTVALLGALALATIALHRGEQINALWLVAAALCSYALGYRFDIILRGRDATPMEK